LPPRMLRRGPNIFDICFTPASTEGNAVADGSTYLADVVLTQHYQDK
jgi:hypothetical protein